MVSRKPNINESDDKSDNFSEDNIKGQESEVVQDARWSRHRVVQVQSLDEYKKSVIEKQRQDPSSKPAVVMNGSSAPTMNYQPLHQSQQEGRSKVNYADVSHGAKLVAWNKDAKGASNLLVPDKDKYLRNPCSVDEKFVVVELAEETLVDTVVIGNLEFHSSNLKNFEVPTRDRCETERVGCETRGTTGVCQMRLGGRQKKVDGCLWCRR